MAQPRKTLKLIELINEVNERLAHSKTGPEGRYALCMLLEQFLFANNAYAGFQYLTEEQVPKGHKPGIKWTGQPGKSFPYHPDDSRRVYSIHYKLKLLRPRPEDAA